MVSTGTRISSFRGYATLDFTHAPLPVQVPDSETILVVKTLLQAETGVPPCQQELRGWGAAHPASAAAVSDARRLSELNLPKENFLFLLTPDVPAIVDITADENVVEASTW